MNITLDELVLPARKVPRHIDQELLPYLARALYVNESDILSWKIIRRSLDARKKPDIKLLYRVRVTLKDGVCVNGFAPDEESVPSWQPPISGGKLKNPLITGAGPAGLFAALILAMAGCCPVVLERGRDVVRRKKDIDAFFRTRDPDPESNFLYGEGGAGTWSDGKLFTRIHDPRIDFVLRTFVEAGAPEEILYFSHPHVGSDRLPRVVAAIREKIIALGGSFLWDSQVVSADIRSGRCFGLRLANGETLSAPAMLIACGHSARSLILSLTGQGVAFAMKGFQTGVRIEHPQSLIDRSQFGAPIPVPVLGAADYALADPASDGSGLVSFCMCPGGEILPAVSEAGRLRTNGMSLYARNSGFSNSALVTTWPADLFDTPEKAFAFLDSCEKRIFESGGSDYTCPAQHAVDFFNGKSSLFLPENSYRLGVVPGRLEKLLPVRLTSALRRALPKFEQRIPGFITQGVLIGMETGVSSPVRFLRDPETLCSSVKNLWIAGEGAGCAGGITSAAVDGIRAAESMIREAQKG